MQVEGRKRPIQEVDDPETPPSPARSIRFTNFEDLFNAYEPQDAAREPNQKTDAPMDASLLIPSDIISITSGSTSGPNGIQCGRSTDGDNVQTAASKNGRKPNLQRLRFPKSWHEAAEIDHVLFRMRKEGHSWNDISNVWKEKTGNDISTKGLAKRYVRLRDELQVFNEGDNEHLLAAVNEVETRFAQQKWRLVAEAMVCRGASAYPENFVRTQYDNLCRSRKLKNGIIGGKDPVPELHDSQDLLKERATDNDKVIGGQPVQERAPETRPFLETEISRGGNRINDALAVDDISSAQSRTVSKPVSSSSLMHPSREGRATNRGPARFTSYRKSSNIDSEALAKPTAPLSKVSEGAMNRLTSSHPASGPLQNAIPVNVQGPEMSKSQGSVEHVPKGSQSTLQAEISQPRVQPETSSEQSTRNVELPAETTTKEFPNKPLPYEKPSMSKVHQKAAAALQKYLEIRTSADSMEATAPFSAADHLQNGVTSATVMPESLAVPSRHQESAASKEQPEPMDISTPVPHSGRLLPSKHTEQYVSPYSPEASPVSSSAMAGSLTPRRRGRPPKSAEKPSPPQTSTASKRSAIMRANWAKRRAKGTDGHRGGPRLSSTVAAKHSTPSKPSSAFASKILAAAAAAAQKQSTVPASSQASEASTPLPEPTPTPMPAPWANAPVDLLTGESMFAHHDEDIPDSGGEPPPAKKIRGPYKKKNIGGAMLGTWTNDTHEHEPDHTKMKAKPPRRFTCYKCGKAYGNQGGLKYHVEHHPNCNSEPRKKDRRTDPDTMHQYTEQSAATSTPPAPIAQMSNANVPYETPSSAPPVHETEVPKMDDLEQLATSATQMLDPQPPSAASVAQTAGSIPTYPNYMYSTIPFSSSEGQQ